MDKYHWLIALLLIPVHLEGYYVNYGQMEIACQTVYVEYSSDGWVTTTIQPCEDQ